MNIRVKAALHTAVLLAGTLVAVIGVHQLVNVLTPDQVMIVFGFVFIGFMVYCLYGITLNRLECEAKLKEIRDQK